jgi:DNA-binding PadR family transcriptional regulator
MYYLEGNHMERKLLLLGMLRTNEMHGYQINELVDMHLGSSIHMTKPTAYRLLNRMVEDGWILFREEQEGNRPLRRVYSITLQGEIEFQKMLRNYLGDYEPPVYRSTVCLAYLDLIPEEEAAQLLRRRRQMVAESLRQLTAGDMHHGSFQLVLDNQICHLNAELEWLKTILDGFNKKAIEKARFEGDADE